MHYTSFANIRKYRRIFVSFAIACLAVTILLAVNALSVARSESVIVTYPLLKSAQPSNTYSVTVNGQPVFVEKYNSLSYIHFAFAGKANIEIAVKENVKDYTLSPKRYKLSSSTNKNKIYFSLTVPIYYCR